MILYEWMCLGPCSLVSLIGTSLFYPGDPFSSLTALSSYVGSPIPVRAHKRLAGSEHLQQSLQSSFLLKPTRSRSYWISVVCKILKQLASTVTFECRSGPGAPPRCRMDLRLVRWELGFGHFWLTRKMFSLDLISLRWRCRGFRALATATTAWPHMSNQRSSGPDEIMHIAAAFVRQAC